MEILWAGVLCYCWWHHVGSLKPTIMGKFTPQKLANIINQSSRPPESLCGMHSSTPLLLWYKERMVGRRDWIEKCKNGFDFLFSFPHSLQQSLLVSFPICISTSSLPWLHLRKYHPQLKTFAFPNAPAAERVLRSKCIPKCFICTLAAWTWKPLTLGVAYKPSGWRRHSKTPQMNHALNIHKSS